MTRVVNLYKEPYDVYIGRTGKGQDGYFGNPIPVGQIVGSLSDERRTEVLRLYREYFEKRLVEDPEFKRRIGELKGKTLGCFCKPKLCHGDVIAEYLNGLG